MPDLLIIIHILHCSVTTTAVPNQVLTVYIGSTAKSNLYTHHSHQHKSWCAGTIVATNSIATIVPGSGVARNIELVGHCLCTLPKAVHRGVEC